jgi:hypothetical protein
MNDSGGEMMAIRGQLRKDRRGAIEYEGKSFIGRENNLKIPPYSEKENHSHSLTMLRYEQHLPRNME